MKIRATPETVKNFLEDAGLNFHKYNKFKNTQKVSLTPNDFIKLLPHKI